MTRLYDGKKILEITINEWTPNGYTPDWSGDFFEVGGLPYNADMDAYEVQDVEYCADQAIDCANGEGDFYGEENYGVVNVEYEFFDM